MPTFPIDRNVETDRDNNNICEIIHLSNYQHQGVKMIEPIYLTIITTTVLMISFYIGRFVGLREVLDTLHRYVENLENE